MITSLEGRRERKHAKSKIVQVLALHYKLVGMYWPKVNEIVSEIACADPGNS